MAEGGGRETYMIRACNWDSRMKERGGGQVISGLCAVWTESAVQLTVSNEISDCLKLVAVAARET